MVLEFENEKIELIEFGNLKQLNLKHAIFNRIFELLLKKGMAQEMNSYEKIIKTKKQLNKWEFLPVFIYLLCIKNIGKAGNTKAVFIQSYNSEPWKVKGKVAFFGNYVGNILIDKLFVCEGEIQGNVSGSDESILEIKGVINGNITQITILILRAGSAIKGDISCKKVILEREAMIHGRIEVGKNQF
jgi:cytoskeletal protein CcmA (bactofilin family)